MPKNRLLLANPKILFLAGVLVLVTAFYSYTLCPSVYLIDSGELATVSYTLGIAHPTGYPLYTLISYFFAHLPGEPVRNLNLLSALFSIAAVAFLYATSYRITHNTLISLTASALFGFSLTIWRTSITNEVYPLTGLFAVLAIYMIYQLKSTRTLYLVMYTMGLALTNHIIFFSVAVPVFIYLLFVYRPSLKQILTGIMFFMLGLSLYLYLITRTIGGAEIAWGNPYNLQRLFWHVTGKQYRVWMFNLTSLEIGQNLLNGLGILARDLLYVFIIPSIAGFVILFKDDRGKFWLMLSILMLNLLYSINYSIPDIAPYYIPSLIVLIVTLVHGVKVFERILKPYVVLPVILLIPLINHGSCTLRNNTFGLDFGRAHAAQLPDSSLLITTHWDVYSPLMYLRHVKNWRKDLVLIDKELLRRTWYIDHIRQEYPQTCNRAESAIDSYLLDLYNFEYDRPYVPSVIQMRFLRMLESLIEACKEKGVFLSMPWPDSDLNSVHPSYNRLPYGLTLMLRENTSVPPYDFARLDLTKPAVLHDDRLKINLGIAQKMLSLNAQYLTATGRPAEAARARAVLETLR